MSSENSTLVWITLVTSLFGFLTNISNHIWQSRKIKRQRRYDAEDRERIKMELMEASKAAHATTREKIDVVEAKADTAYLEANHANEKLVTLTNLAVKRKP